MIISNSSADLITINYLKRELTDICASSKSGMESYSGSGAEFIEIDISKQYETFLKAMIKDKIADIITIYYKYIFFKKRVKCSNLCEFEREILLCSVISADLEDDKREVKNQINNFDALPIDGFYNFTMKNLKYKWLELSNYIPKVFMKNQYIDFVSFLLENESASKKIYVYNDNVYDKHYNPLTKSTLLEGCEIGVLKEIILSRCNEIEIISGKSGGVSTENGISAEGDAEKYLKQIYKSRIVYKAECGEGLKRLSTT